MSRIAFQTEIDIEKNRVYGVSTFAETLNIFASLNTQGLWYVNEELNSQIPIDALFCIMANYEWKRIHNQGGSDLEEKIHPYVHLSAMNYINALVKFWINKGHKEIPFRLYNGINFNNMYNVLTKAEEANKNLPVYFGNKR